MKNIILIIWERTNKDTRISEFCNMERPAEVSILLLAVPIHDEYFFRFTWLSFLIFVKFGSVEIRILNNESPLGRKPFIF